jgi:23S rRNA A1618 N6-methylase RlmF
MDRPSYLVPLVPRRTAVDLVHRIADLKAEATTRGYGTLAYFLDIAEREATIQADQGAHDLKAKHVLPSDLWLPKG